MRVSAAVLVLVKERVVVVREVVTVVPVAGVADAAAAAGCNGAFEAWRFSLAKIVMPTKLLSVIAEASTRSASVEVMSGLARRGRSVMWIGEHPPAAGA
ncbi:MAG TPA: hypothetical protein VGK07_11080 [Candidatus Limnocylindria bacterium]